MHDEVALRYSRAVVREIEVFEAHGRELPAADTVYFGGGTPSIVPPEQIAAILTACRSAFRVLPDCEITLEANPGTLTAEKAASYRAMGVNRISMGAQSFFDAELTAIGRSHRAEDTSESVALLRAGGIANINLDLMAGLPDQDQARWTANLERMVALRPSHISMYMLDLDAHSPLYHSVASGAFRLPEDDQVADFYLETIDHLERCGYVQYEISNFALPGRESRHNMKYWNCEPVLAFGVSSHSYDGTARYANLGNLNAYLEAVEKQGSALDWREPDEPEHQLQETLFLGLRLRFGVDWHGLREAFGAERVAAYEPAVTEMAAHGLLIWEGGRVRLTRRGMLLSNEVFQRFV